LADTKRTRGQPEGSSTSSSSRGGSLPISQIESILQTQGTVSNDVLMIEQDRTDLQVTGPNGVPFLPPFALDNTFAFQSLSKGQAMVNGELTLLPEETNPIIDAILSNNLVFQAFHMHYIEESPQTWHIHLRGMSDAVSLAKAVAQCGREDRDAAAPGSATESDHAIAGRSTGADTRRRPGGGR
jgi:hypothetical protein